MVRNPDAIQKANPGLFRFIALLIASNGTGSRVGSLTAGLVVLAHGNLLLGASARGARIEREDELRRASVEVMLRGTCDRARFLDLVEKFRLFSEHEAGAAENHLGEPPVPRREQCDRLDAGRAQAGARSRCWRTQGRGKSFSMVCFEQKVLRKVAGNRTFVVVTDRVELDDQIAKTLKAPGAVSESEGDQSHAASGAHLRALRGKARGISNVRTADARHRCGVCTLL